MTVVDHALGCKRDLKYYNSTNKQSSCQDCHKLSQGCQLSHTVRETHANESDLTPSLHICYFSH